MPNLPRLNKSSNANLRATAEPMLSTTNAVYPSLAALTYYSPTAHHLHPLHNTWLKLTARQIQALHVPSSFHSTVFSPNGPPLSLYHLLNHPIPFVEVCGPVVGVEFVEKVNAWSVLVDDGSGVLLEVLVRKGTEEEESWLGSFRSGSKGRIAGPGELIVPPVPEWRGRGWVGGEEVDIRLVEVGRVLKVKGRVREWRGSKQVVVERIFPIRTTADEVKFWQSMCKAFESFLTKPWAVSNEQLQALRKKASEPRRRKKKREGRRRGKVEKETRQRQQDTEAKKNSNLGHTVTEQEHLSKRSKSGRGSAHIAEQAVHNTTELDPDQVGRSSEPKNAKGQQELETGQPSRNGFMDPQLITIGSPNVWPTTDAEEHGADEELSTQLPPPATTATTSLLTSSAEPNDETENPREQLQDERKDRLVVDEGPTGQWVDLELDVASSSQPPPGNQQAWTNDASAAASFRAAVASSEDRVEPVPELEFVNKGLPSEWETLDVHAARAEEEGSRVLHGAEWLEFRNRGSAEGRPLISASDILDDDDVWDGTGVTKGSAAEEGEGSVSLYNWEDEWDRVDL